MVTKTGIINRNGWIIRLLALREVGSTTNKEVTKKCFDHLKFNFGKPN